MKKLIKTIMIVSFGITLAFVVLYFLAGPRMDFNFANDGHIICTENKSWGIFSKGDLNCFGIVPIVQLPTPTPQKLSPTGEIMLNR